MPDSDVPLDALKPGGVSRRAVLQAGAWAAPVILLAAGVPAASASMNKVLDFTNFSLWYTWGEGGRRGIVGNTTVFLSGDVGASVPFITLAIQVSAQNMAPTATATGAGWQFTSASSDGTRMTYVFTYSGLPPITGINTPVYTTQLGFRLDTTDVIAEANQTWYAQASANGAIGAERSGGLASFDPDALLLELDGNPGALSLDGSTLRWSGAKITYTGPGTAHVPYSARLLHDDDLIAVLPLHGADVLSGTEFAVPEMSYQLSDSGSYSAILVVFGTDGEELSAATTAVTYTA